MHSSTILILATLAVVPFIATAQEIDENELFGDTALTIVDSAKLFSTSTSLAGTDSTAASFSGAITSVAEPAVSRDWFSSRDRNDASLSSLMLGSLSLDVRLPFGTKAFATAESFYLPDSSRSFFTVPELFLDVNFSHAIYFRAGKQVLQWGRGYFWNPTDLVNVEKKSFIPKIGAREGTYGIKTHIPFGTAWNIYGFLDMNKTASVDSLAAAARFEGLFGGTEAGFALWGKHGKDPFFGFDISTTLFSWSCTGEMSITSGDNYRLLDLDETFATFSNRPALIYAIPKNDAVVRLSVSAMRSFDLLDVDDRMMVVGEFYFNQLGDNGNLFKKNYMIGDSLRKIGSLFDDAATRQIAQSMAAYAFEFNSIARYYGAFFVTISRFIVQDMSLQVNSLVNFNHHCAIATAGVQYATMHNLSLGCLVTGYIGPEESEYTFTNSGASVRLTAGVGF